MTTVDLITGFLGSGKTTFIKKYVRRLMDSGERVCILENDYGAVNVDTMLLQELSDSGCGIEMVSGACDKDCHIRRFKTKLIAMAMSGYTRVVIEPSGIFDVDEFFDSLREPPLDRWYRLGSVVTIVDPTMKEELSESGEFLLASQASVAGAIVFSHCRTAQKSDIDESIDKIEAAMKKISADSTLTKLRFSKPWDELTDDDFKAISESGCKKASYIKMYGEDEAFGSVYFLGLDPSPEKLGEISSAILSDSSCGHVFRIKGFTKDAGGWVEFNVTKRARSVKPIPNGQSVVIVIGENLDKNRISEYFK